MAVNCSGDAKQAVVVKQTQGEYLHYHITAEGANPQFAFGCAHRHILSAENFPNHPATDYEWIYLRNPVDSDAADDGYGVSMLFVAATKYQLVIEHRASDNSVIEVLCNKTCTGSPTDIARQSLEVLCA